MFNKKIIQEMFNEQFNKDNNYQKILSKVKGVSNMKNIVLKFSLVPICFILVVCGVILLKTSANTDEFIKVTENDKQEIYINKLKDFAQTSLDADIEVQETSYILEQYKFLNNIKISNDLHMSSSYLVYTRNDIKVPEYNVLHDYVVNYEKREIELTTKSITIAFSKDFKPLRDYYIDTTSLKMSKINDTELTITNYNDMYITEFNYNNLNFNIETKGITQDELVDLLESIIK